MTDNRTTELLCKLLEERGEEYVCNDFGITWSYYGDPHTATESMDGTLIVTGLTPEQAIAATLGGGECELTDNGPWGYPYVCSACGASFDPDVNGGEFNYCPNCGAKVVER